MDQGQTTPPTDPPGWGERRRREGASSPPGGDRFGHPADPAPFDDLYADVKDDRPPQDAGEWSSRYGSPPPPPRSPLDFSALFVLLDVVRKAAPAELQERVTRLIREALLTLRSLIDWYLERLDRSPREPQVEDIPID